MRELMERLKLASDEDMRNIAKSMVAYIKICTIRRMIEDRSKGVRIVQYPHPLDNEFLWTIIDCEEEDIRRIYSELYKTYIESGRDVMGIYLNG